MSTNTNLTRRKTAIIAALLVLIIGVSAVMAQQFPNADGRLNQIATFGGDTLYCMDSSDNVTNDSATFSYFELLDINGQPIWTIDRDTVELGLGQITLEPTAYLLGEGQGTYGPVYLYANAAQDGSPYFIFIGFDEWGKQNMFTFYGCTPEGSALPAASSTSIAPTPMGTTQVTMR